MVDDTRITNPKRPRVASHVAWTLRMT